MFKNLFIGICILFGGPFGFSAPHHLQNLDVVGRIPIMHEGRLKPLETFAQAHLLMIYGKSSFENKSAIHWLMALLFEPEKSYENPVFIIRNSQVLATLKIEVNSDHLYAFKELSRSFGEILDQVHAWHQLKKEERTPAQNQLVELYLKSLRYYEISRSLSMVFPLGPSTPEDLVKAVESDSKLAMTYLDVIPNYRKLRGKLSGLENKKPEQLSESEKITFEVVMQMEKVRGDGRSHIFRVIPPQWGRSEAWISPWALVDQSKGSPASMRFLKNWRDLYVAYHSGKKSSWDQASLQLAAISNQMTQHLVSTKHMTLEQKYIQWDLFFKSLLIYVLSFLLISASWIWNPRLLRKISTWFLVVGFGLHVTGIIMRVIIMGRPPVSTLYESVIFVGAIGVMGALIIEWVRKNGLGTFIAATSGIVLHFVARSYVDDGDTMGMLVAVLNTNFWLATHVLTITIGYGCSLVAGLLAHVYLFRRIWKPRSKKILTELYQNTMGVALFALLFSLIGTILGGIWADQSWGRFWGWDPKENGAMLLVLWLITLIHGKISGLLKEDGFAVGMVLTNIVVALAWFGVNLLNVGLHSYGFTDSAAFSLFLFCGLESLIALSGYIVIQKRIAGH